MVYLREHEGAVCSLGRLMLGVYPKGCVIKGGVCGLGGLSWEGAT